MAYRCRLKVILAEKDILHGDFAGKLGVSKTTLSLIINSKSKPSFDVTYKICKELNLDIREIWEEK